MNKAKQVHGLLIESGHKKIAEQFKYLTAGFSAESIIIDRESDEGVELWENGLIPLCIEVFVSSNDGACEVICFDSFTPMIAGVRDTNKSLKHYIDILI